MEIRPGWGPSRPAKRTLVNKPPLLAASEANDSAKTLRRLQQKPQDGGPAGGPAAPCRLGSGPPRPRVQGVPEPARALLPRADPDRCGHRAGLNFTGPAAASIKGKFSLRGLGAERRGRGPTPAGRRFPPRDPFLAGEAGRRGAPGKSSGVRPGAHRHPGGHTGAQPPALPSPKHPARSPSGEKACRWHPMPTSPPPGKRCAQAPRRCPPSIRRLHPPLPPWFSGRFLSYEKAWRRVAAGALLRPSLCCQVFSVLGAKRRAHRGAERDAGRPGSVATGSAVPGRGPEPASGPAYLPPPSPNRTL